jgi:hypothetical protein
LLITTKNNISNKLSALLHALYGTEQQYTLVDAVQEVILQIKKGRNESVKPKSG